MNNSVEQALVASLDKFAEAKKIDSIAIEQRLIDVFGKDMNFLEKVAEFDEVFDEHPAFDELQRGVF
jgi:hypothetical protein